MNQFRVAKSKGVQKIKTLKKIGSHVIAFVLGIIIIFGVSQGVKVALDFFDVLEGVTSYDIAAFIGLVSSIFLFSFSHGRYLRSTKEPLSIVGVGVNNFFYDPDLEKPDISNLEKIHAENKELNDELEDFSEYASDLLDEVEIKNEELEEVVYTSQIFIRHHKNSSRLVRSLLQLINENKYTWQFEFFNNVLDECVTVLHQDRADKSSTIYFINNDELEMFAYNRIEFDSSRKRKFKKGEGFAGHIWESGETRLISNVNESEFFEGNYRPKHSYGSIIGLPIKIGSEIIGVLCIQSEGTDEFNEEDIHTLKFYADICALAYYYDKMVIRN